MTTNPATNNKTAPDIGEIFALLRDDLAQVEAELARHANSAIEPVAAIARHLQESGGKRLRPALHLLGAKFCGYEGRASVHLGAVLELIHTATLLHDDVIDAADTRRGQISSNRRWGNPMTVLAGDWLYMESFRIALGERNYRILDVLIGLTQTMVEGELLQLTTLGKLVDEAQALDIARRKTACLFSVSMQLAALLGGKSPEDEQRLAVYGLNLGLAFQIIDDLLDFTSTSERLGKPVVSDLKEGKMTLPLVLALERAPHARAKVDAVLHERGFQSVSPQEIVGLVRETGAIERTQARAAELAAEAGRALEPFPDSVYKRALEALPQFVLTRDY
ncbi:MAG TPA: polyprenyl synthetase family protein [Candidatus Xenobia bacterium]|nr:polyprenyl synthetase family protein [Candidatus Xenobia bacterium]